MYDYQTVSRRTLKLSIVLIHTFFVFCISLNAISLTTTYLDKWTFSPFFFSLFANTFSSFLCYCRWVRDSCSSPSVQKWTWCTKNKTTQTKDWSCDSWRSHYWWTCQTTPSNCHWCENRQNYPDTTPNGKHSSRQFRWGLDTHSYFFYKTPLFTFFFIDLIYCKLQVQLKLSLWQTLWLGNLSIKLYRLNMIPSLEKLQK